MAILGALCLIACTIAMLFPAYRNAIARFWRYGMGGGAIGLLAIALFLSLILQGPDRKVSLYIEWGAMALFAGFGFGITIEAGVRWLRRQRHHT
jgi:hypothetical protein